VAASEPTCNGNGMIKVGGESFSPPLGEQREVLTNLVYKLCFETGIFSNNGERS